MYIVRKCTYLNSKPKHMHAIVKSRTQLDVVVNWSSWVLVT